MFGGNATLHPREHARVAEQRLERLTHLARDIASATRCRDVARITAREACIVTGARAAIVVACSRDGSTLQVVASHNASPALIAQWDGLPIELEHPLARTCRSAAPEWLDLAQAESAALPGVALTDGPPGGFAALPLCAEHRAVGAVGLSFGGRSLPPGHERDFLATLIELCAQGYVRALRHDIERSERVAAARLGVMLEAGQAISRATDAREVIARLGELVVPRFADWAAVDLVEPNGALRLGAVVHADSGKVLCGYEGDRELALPPAAAARALFAVLRTGEPQLFEEAPSDLVRSPSNEDAHLLAARGEGMRSAMVVPLAARDSVLGAVTLVSAREGLRYDEMDLRLACKVAQHAALALDNARLIEAERAARFEAQSANRMKDAFLATVSHELRTPLHAILGWSTLLRSGTLDARGRERAVETIERNARAQARLVDDVLDVSRIISGKLSLELADIEVSDVVTRAVDVVWPTAQAKGVALEVFVPSRLGTMKADRGRIEQVFWNILSNAVKFTPAGGRVRVEASIQAHDVVVRVVDTGKGIRPEFLAYVFEPFHQQDTSTTRSHGGLGLGLSIAHHLVRLHGGLIKVESEGDGRGATFEIRLPLEVVPLTREPALARESSREARD